MESGHIRLIPAHPDLAVAVTDYYRRNRDFLRSTDPVRAEEFYTGEFQRKLLSEAARAPTPAPFTARPYEPGDYEFVYELKKLCYRNYVEALWGWNEADQRTRFARFMREDGAEERMFLLLQDGQAVGMTNYEFSGADTLEICNICLLPQCRGRGIGGALLGRYIAQNTRPTLTLQVYKDNPARRLYERLGFCVYEETDTHYKMKLTKEV